MQVGFVGTLSTPKTNSFSVYKPVIRNVVKEIEEARRNNHGIIIVKFANFHGDEKDNQIVPEISEALNGYKRYSVIYKRNADGSKEIFREVKKRKFPKTFFRVCGVYSNACVPQTIFGLLSRKSTRKIEVPKKAVDDANDMRVVEYIGLAEFHGVDKNKIHIV